MSYSIVKPTILLVEARFYSALADELALGALDALSALPVAVERLEVPGALEIPAAIRFAARSGRYQAYVALGCVIRGETTHYDYVCEQSARALMDLSLQDGLAIGNGILTVENEGQAWARAKRSEKNKGAVAAQAALRMLEIKQLFTR